MRFLEYIEDLEDLDIIDLDIDEKIIDDWGKVGKEFERKLIQTLELLGLKFDVNRYAGSTWDIKPKGSGWNKLSGKKVNIKKSRTKWMFGSKQIYNMLPWDGFKGKFNEKKAAEKVKKFLIDKDIDKVLILKPISPEIQYKIMDLPDIKNANTRKKKAKEILSKNNWYIEGLGKDWNVRVLTKENRVSSVAIDSGGKVFMRSEKPREIGGTNNVVTFRTPTHVPGKGNQGSVIK